MTRSRIGSRRESPRDVHLRESPDGVHLPGQRAKLRVQRVARLLAIMVRLLGIRGGAEPGGDEPGGDEPGDASDAAGRRGTRRRHERRGEKHADAAAVAGTREIQSFGASKRGETTRERLSRRGRVSSERGRTDQPRQRRLARRARHATRARHDEGRVPTSGVAVGNQTRAGSVERVFLDGE